MAQKNDNIVKFKLSRISRPRTWNTGILTCIVTLTLRCTLIFHETRRYFFNVPFAAGWLYWRYRETDSFKLHQNVTQPCNVKPSVLRHHQIWELQTFENFESTTCCSSVSYHFTSAKLHIETSFPVSYSPGIVSLTWASWPELACVFFFHNVFKQLFPVASDVVVCQLIKWLKRIETGL